MSFEKIVSRLRAILAAAMIGYCAHHCGYMEGRGDEIWQQVQECGREDRGMILCTKYGRFLIRPELQPPMDQMLGVQDE